MLMVTPALGATTIEPKHPDPPKAAVRPVEETIFGTVVHDPYRWMEQMTAPEFVAWVNAQADYARATLDHLPWHETILRRASELAGVRTDIKNVSTLAGHFYYLKLAPGDDHFKLYTRDSLEGAERLVADPGVTEPGKHSSIDWYAPSPDGRYIALGISTGGSENPVLRLLEVSSGRMLPDRIDRARDAVPQWRSDGRSFFYSRQQKVALDSRGAMEKMRCYLHVLGTDPDRDPPVFGFDVSPRVPMSPSDMSVVLAVPGSDYAIGLINHGALWERTVYYARLDQVVNAATPWKKLFDVDDAVTDFDVHGSDIYLLTHKGAPHSKVIATRLDAPDLAHARTVVPASRAIVRSVTTAADALYVRLSDGGLGQLLRIPYDGAAAERVALPYQGTIGELYGNTTTPGIIFSMQTWVHPQTLYRDEPLLHRVVDTGWLPPPPFDTAAFESVEVTATSRDGTSVPLSIVYKKGLKLDGKNPTWLSGYGSYGASFDPNFEPRRLAWLERGGVYAAAHVRGGGEFGEEWHAAGTKRTKQNTIDDFIACARYLIEHRYTAPAHLGAEGSSAGGITVGGAITQHPELFGAALIRGGLSDAVRVEQMPGGSANAREFGSAANAEEFPALFAMSAFHHVKDGVRYPAVMVSGSENDVRIPLWQSAKMAARLQAASASHKPVLLRVARDAGHGSRAMAASAFSAELADCYSFFYWQLAPRSEQQ